jgi:signal transduction histidine kinase/CheY-like chemotaxis protein
VPNVLVWKRNNYLFWISLCATAMVLAMGLLLINQLVQKQAIEESARQRVDSVTALVSYAERELLRLQKEMAVQLANTNTHALDRDRLQLRYDIFLSGIAWLRDSPSMRALAGRPQYTELLPKLERLQKVTDAAFARPQLQPAELAGLLAQLDDLQIDLMALSSAASSVESSQFESQTRKMLEQSQLIMGLALLQIGLLLVATLALVRRQRLQLQEQQAMQAMNEALRQERGRAEAANRAKSQFLANMSHELRTPFNGILGLLKILQSTGLNNRQQDYANTMERTTTSLLALINDILDYSKVESGKLELHRQPFSLERLLCDVSEILSAGAGSESLDVLFDVDPQVGGLLLGDALKLQQVLINLASNAIKFTAQGHVVLAVRRLPAQAVSGPGAGDGAGLGADLGPQVEFAVRDTGIGIAPEQQSHIFSAFTQAEASTTREYGGTGLGLAISLRLVDLMGGRLTLHSVPGEGSTFSFVLPLPVLPEPAAQQAQGPLAPQQLQQLQRHQPQRVLVVDDNPVAQDVLCRMASGWGWACTRADSGDAALAQLQAGLTSGQAFDLVLLDWHLPGMDGWELARRIRQMVLPADSPPPRLLMLTSTGRDRLAERTEPEQALIDGLLQRPFTAAQLRQAALEPGSSPARLRQGVRVPMTAARLQGMRILVVEDNPLNQQVAQELLALEGAQVVLAANGQLGVKAVAAAHAGPDRPFDVVLMDLQMPVLDGFGATRAIRQTLSRDQLPIIAMTANAMDSDRAACLAADMNEHIGKPFDMGRLVSLLTRITGFRPPVATLREAERPDTVRAERPDPAAAEVPGLDLAAALQRMAGVRPLYVRAAQDFSASLGGLVASLDATWAAGDLATLRRQLHTLRGNAATLGATALAQHAAELEALQKTGFPAERWAALLARLEPLVQASQASLQQAIAQLASPTAMATPAAGAQPAAAQDLAAALRLLPRLVGLLQNADMDALLCFAENRQTLDALGSTFCDSLDRALQDLDLEQALVRCNQRLAEA